MDSSMNLSDFAVFVFKPVYWNILNNSVEFHIYFQH